MGRNFWVTNSRSSTPPPSPRLTVSLKKLDERPPNFEAVFVCFVALVVVVVFIAAVVVVFFNREVDQLYHSKTFVIDQQ